MAEDSAGGAPVSSMFVKAMQRQRDTDTSEPDMSISKGGMDVAGPPGGDQGWVELCGIQPCSFARSGDPPGGAAHALPLADRLSRTSIGDQLASTDHSEAESRRLSTKSKKKTDIQTRMNGGKSGHSSTISNQKESGTNSAVQVDGDMFDRGQGTSRGT